jgi:Uma2 family endonuclease
MINLAGASPPIPAVLRQPAELLSDFERGSAADTDIDLVKHQQRTLSCCFSSLCFLEPKGRGRLRRPDATFTSDLRVRPYWQRIEFAVSSPKA